MSKWPNSDQANPYNNNNSELRDIFALLAMHALILEKGYNQDVCKRSYEIADQMLEERDK